MTDRLHIPFSGDGAGVGELTWGQKGLWQTMRLSGESVTMGGVDPLPPGTTIDGAIDSLRHVLSRHPSLRTRLRIDPDGHAQQVVAGAGELPVEIVEVPPGEDPAEAAAAVSTRYQSVNFDYTDEWPLRMALICRDGVPTHAVAIYLHLAIDAHGMDALMADSLTVGPDAPPMDAITPLELARQQATPAAQRQCEASLRHLEQVLRTVAPRRFGPPSGPTEPGYQQVGYASRALLLAARAVAARTGVGTNPVLLAAFAVTLARHTGINPVLTMLPVSNRFRPGFAGMVSPVAQVSPCLLDVAGISFRAAVGHAARAAMHAYKHAYYDPDLRLALIERVNRERGEEIDISCFFNDRRRLGRSQPDSRLATLDDVRAALPDSRLSWVPEPMLSKQRLYLNLNDLPDAIELTMSADTECLSTVDMVAIVRGIEAVAVEMLTDPDARTGVPTAPALEEVPAR